MDEMFYNSIISSDRLDQSPKFRTLNEEFISDKSRIIFSSPFRRLQQKAQVFSLETNASVRSRLTHTLEVATIGISIAEKVVTQLIDQKALSEKLAVPFVKIVENACLLHDIGNPPFGHFAEEAIKKWFRKHWQKVFFKSTNLDKNDISELEITKTYINDFLQFDGNPQALRIVLTLQDIKLPGEGNNFTDRGLNLTCSQIASIIKYIASPNEVNKSHHLYKKAGYFHSEGSKISDVKKSLGLKKRYPLTYIMEAADDICYCISDIEDGIEKKILTPRAFFERLNEEFKSLFNLDNSKFHELILAKNTVEEFYEFKIKLMRDLEEYVARRYISNHENLINGELAELIDENSDEGKILISLKSLSRKYIFRSREAENKELVGYHAIYGLLNKYKVLLKLEEQKFYSLVNAKLNLTNVSEKGMEFHWRLFNRLPQRYVEAYLFSYKKGKSSLSKENFKQFEWFHRAHLIVDYVSGMTDNYVLETYNLLYGITI